MNPIVVTAVIWAIPICPIVHMIAVNRGGGKCECRAGDHDIVIAVVNIVIIDAHRGVVRVVSYTQKPPS